MVMINSIIDSNVALILTLNFLFVFVKSKFELWEWTQVGSKLPVLEVFINTRVNTSSYFLDQVQQLVCYSPYMIL
jgi:hypothetical protein